MNVPQSTIEKPLTAIDYIACLEQCSHFGELVDFANKLPSTVVEDDRFARAFKKRLDAIKDRKAAA